MTGSGGTTALLTLILANACCKSAAVIGLDSN